MPEEEKSLEDMKFDIYFFIPPDPEPKKPKLNILFPILLISLSIGLLVGLYIRSKVRTC